MVELVLRLVFSLAVVLGLLLVLARLLHRRAAGGAGSGVAVVHRQALGRSSALAVVRVGDRLLVLGTTEHQVSLLAELEPDALAVPLEHPVEHPVDDLLDAPLDVPPPAPVRAGAHRAVPATGGPLAGSALSPETWRQAVRAVNRSVAPRRAS